MPGTQNLDPSPGDMIDDADFLDVLNLLNTERSRRGDPDISIDVTDNGAQVDLEDYNTLATNINNMSGQQPPAWSPVPLESVGDLIEANDIDRLVDAINEWTATCVCDCNYCTCDCNYCACDCNYCTCDCNYGCTCNCNYCTCDCNYCTCDCNYSCTCDCNYSDIRLKTEIHYF